MIRFACLFVVAMICMSFVVPVLAADITHEGKLVKAGDGKMTMTDSKGGAHEHAVAGDAKITLNGNAVKLEDLKNGDGVTVTYDAATKVASKIAATR